MIATALMAVSTFQVLYGGEARMYALLQLLGVAIAVVTEQWLRAPRRWHAAVRRRAAARRAVRPRVGRADRGRSARGGRSPARPGRVDVARRARRCRCVWAAVWGLVLVDQLHGQWASWIPHTTPWTFATTVSRQVTLAEAVAPFVLAAVIGGGVVLCRRDRVLGRMWLALGVLPFALAAVIGVFASFLFDRTLTLASWAPLMAIAFLLDAGRRRWRTAGTAIVVTVMLIVTLASCTFLLEKRWDYDLSVERLEQVARPGDVIAVRPARYGILVDWRIGVRGDAPTPTGARARPRRRRHAAGDRRRRGPGRVLVADPAREPDRLPGVHAVRAAVDRSGDRDPLPRARRRAVARTRTSVRRLDRPGTLVRCGGHDHDSRRA